MRYVYVMLLGLIIAVVTALAAVPPAVQAQPEGPSVCQYRDGTVLNFRGLPCPAVPFWTRE